MAMISKGAGNVVYELRGARRSTVVVLIWMIVTGSRPARLSRIRIVWLRRIDRVRVLRNRAGEDRQSCRLLRVDSTLKTAWLK